jgi:hypothetical protein
LISRGISSAIQSKPRQSRAGYPPSTRAVRRRRAMRCGALLAPLGACQDAQAGETYDGLADVRRQAARTVPPRIELRLEDSSRKA